MTSKNFKSAVGGFSIGIHSVKDGVQFRITNMRGNYQQFTTPSSVAAEQALAILEAAGVVPTQHSDSVDEGSQETLEDVMYWLTRHVRSAEAEAQAKLEAEALRLANEFYGTDWDFFPCSRTVEMQQWLAVARRAREMRAEK